VWWLAANDQCRWWNAESVTDAFFEAALQLSECIIPGVIERPLHDFCHSLLLLPGDRRRPWFTVDRAFDLSASLANANLPVESIRLLDDAGNAQWDALCLMQRQLLVPQPPVFSSKRVLYEWLNASSLPFMPIRWAGDAHDPLSPVVPTLMAACASWPRSGGDVIVKPSHTVRSQGVQRFRLDGTLNCTAVLDAVQTCFALKPDPRASHMVNVPAGAVIQDMFPHHVSAYGRPHPFELKILVVWGKTLVINTEQIPGSKYLFPDGTYSGTNVGLMRRLLHTHVPILTRVAEALARAIGSPTLRVDFFVNDHGWALNELELVSGVGYHDFHVQP